MNKQSTSKFALFLTGLEQRISENLDFFKKITVDYKSGTKTYRANISLENNKLKLNFNGRTEIIEISWLSLRLSKFSESYENLLLTYEERGTTIYIEADQKNVKMKTGETAGDEGIKPQADTSHMGNRDYLIKVGMADELLKEIGILSPEGKVKNDMIRKYNQIDHFVELIQDLLKDLADQHENITVLDCGCGKSYLTFVLNYYIKEVMKKPCYFIGLDYSNNVIEASKRMAANLGYHNMEFRVTDIKNYHASRDIHLVVSLHACDTATDEAIALAVNNKAKAMVMIPCCHKELLGQYKINELEPVLKYGILKARMADVLTDGLRGMLLEAMGYKVSIVEYISPLETPKNLMLRAQKSQDRNEKQLQEYMNLIQRYNIHPMLKKLILPE